LGRLNTFDRFCIIWFVAMNVCTFTAFGCWPAGIIGMKLFRHKTTKWTFKLKYGLALLPFAAEIWAWWRWR
jgi:uncharacterized membrane protein YsdA (DUF1294 family)